MVTIDDSYKVPSVVMSTASTPINVSAPLELEWPTQKATSEYCIYMYFAEVVKLKANHSRSFNITLNGEHWYGPDTPKYLRTGMVHSTSILEINQTYDFLLSKIENSTLPPIINALEIYSTIDLTQLGTDIQDGMFSSTRQSSALHFFFFFLTYLDAYENVIVDAVTNIKSTYALQRNWEGDPCLPRAYSWAGLSCSYDTIKTPRVTSL